MELILIVLMSSLPMAGVTGESDVIGSHEPVHVFVRDDAILPCHLEPPFNVMNLTVEWSRNKTKVHVYRSRKDDPSVQDKHFKGRTFLFHDNMKDGNISLKLSNVTEKDAGNYSCFVPKLQSQVKRGNVKLIVEPMRHNKDNTTAGQGGERKMDPTQKPNTSEQPAGQNIATYTGIGVGALLLIISILIAIYFGCYRENSPCRGRCQSGGNGQNAPVNQEDNREMEQLNTENQ